jgi:hypothetical protein
MWLATVSATATFVATLSAVATIGSFFAYLYFGRHSNANAAREEALALAETRREVIEDLRNRLASSDERHRRLKAKREKRVRELEKALDNARTEARDQAYQMQRLYAIGLADVLAGIRSDLAAVPPDAEGALERIRKLIARAQPTAR